MYVIARHQIKDPDTAFPRGEKLIAGEDAPEGVRVLQFYPSRDASVVSCLWEAGSVEQVQRYVDSVLADSSDNTCYEVDLEQSFSERPLGLPTSAAGEAAGAMTVRENVELVRQAYAAVGQGEIPRLLEMMSEDVEIQLPGPTQIPFTGTYRGREEAGQLFLTLAESAKVERFEPIEYIAHGDQVVVLGHEQLTAKPTGRTWATDWVMCWTVHNGEITALREFHQTAEIAAAFNADGTPSETKNRAASSPR